MKIPVDKIIIILFSIYLFSCETDRYNNKYGISGNWSTIIDSVYIEICFRGDTLERFNLEWDFLPPAIYSIDNDSLIINGTLDKLKITKYKISFIDSVNVVLEDLNTKLILKKIPNNEYTIDDLINKGYFHFGYDNPTSDSLRENFVDSAFRIREIKYLIENNLLNKDTIIAFWNSQIVNDSINQDYYKSLIEKINKNLP